MGLIVRHILITGFLVIFTTAPLFAFQSDSVLVSDSVVEIFEADDIIVEVDDSLQSELIHGLEEEDTLREELIQFSHQYEYVPEYESDIIEERLALIEGEIELTFNSKVKSFINYFTVTNREYTKKVAARQTKYFPMIEKYLEKYDLPDELKYLAIVESGLNPKAQSPAGAVGLWQFMPLTGRLDYGLSENWYMDEKMDMEKSTDAACRYLSFLYKYFDNNWHFALAAYNTGPGNLRKAIRKSGYKKTFWEIYPYLYRETRSYVPQFIAIMYSMNYLEQHNIFVEEYEYLPTYETIEVSGFLNLPLFAEHSGICMETLDELNPELKKGAISGLHGKYPLRIPTQHKEWVSENLDDILIFASQGKEHFERLAKNEVGSTYGRQKLVYRVQSGDVLGKIAQRYEVRIADIRNWNNISGNIIRVGQPLNIWLTDDYYQGVNETLSKISKQGVGNSNTTLKDGEYKVQSGDTLWDISRKFEGLTIEKLKKINNLEGSGIKPGQILKISENS